MPCKTCDLTSPHCHPNPCTVGTVTVVSPLELMRTKLQARHVSYRELGACVRAAVAQGGWRSLWLGWGPTALRDVPFSGRHPGCKGWMREPWSQRVYGQVPAL